MRRGYESRAMRRRMTTPVAVSATPSTRIGMAAKPVNGSSSPPPVAPASTWRSGWPAVPPPGRLGAAGVVVAGDAAVAAGVLLAEDGAAPGLARAGTANCAALPLPDEAADGETGAGAQLTIAADEHGDDGQCVTS